MKCKELLLFSPCFRHAFQPGSSRNCLFDRFNAIVCMFFFFGKNFVFLAREKFDTIFSVVSSLYSTQCWSSKYIAISCVQILSIRKTNDICRVLECLVLEYFSFCCLLIWPCTRVYTNTTPTWIFKVKKELFRFFSRR